MSQTDRPGIPGRTARRNRPDRRRNARTADRARRDHRQADRGQGAAGRRIGVPARARGGHDAGYRVAPSRPAAARHGREHLAGDHFDLHLRPVALFRSRRHVGRRRRHARFGALSLRLHGALASVMQVPAKPSRRWRARRGRTAAAISACCARNGGPGTSDGGTISPARTRRRSSAGCPSSSGPIIPRACRSSSFPIRWPRRRRATSCCSPRDGPAKAPTIRPCARRAAKCLARAATSEGVSLLISAPGERSAEDLAAALQGRFAWIGSHAERFALHEQAQ